jgi:hypothetical protein
MPAAIACFIEEGNSGDETLAEAKAGREDEGQPCQRTAPERYLPRHLHAHHNGAGKEEVMAHGRSNGDRIVRQERHQRSRERGRQTRRRKNRPEVHAGGTKDGRLDKDDVGHGQECRQARDHLRSNGRAVSGQLEARREESSQIEVVLFSAKRR